MNVKGLGVERTGGAHERALEPARGMFFSERERSSLYGMVP